MNRKNFGAFLALVLAVAHSSLTTAGQCPHVAVLIDTSGSMSQDPSDATPIPPALSKLAIATSTLQTKVLTPYDGKIPIGFASFPTDGDCGVGGLTVPIAYGTKGSIMMKVPATPGGNTPMCTAIDAVAKDAAFTDPDRTNSIILITDGLPNCTCDVASTTAAITKARMQSPPVYTFVVGFGINMADSDNLSMMATAGGVPASNYGQKQAYYKADSAAGLELALAQIMDILTGGDAGNGSFCDDSCYQNSCTKTTDICVAGSCSVNPCDTFPACAAGQYCYTDGKSASCAMACTMSCADDKSCDPGTGLCSADPCGGPCGDKEMCTAGRCVKDPRCTAVTCKSGQVCTAGLCKEDPCRYIKCPANHQCVPLTGACTGFDPVLGVLPMRPVVDDGAKVEGGLQCTTTGGRSGRGLLPLIGAALLVLFRLHGRARARRIAVRLS